MTFEFYKNRINQDMLDDLKINRIIIERTKQQAKRFDEIRAEDAGLTDFQLDDFNKIYLSFSSTLDDYVNKLEANTEIFRNAGLVIYRYNLLATVLNKLKFNFLPKTEKDKLVNQLEDLEPKIEELYRYANINDFTDLKTIGEILNNFKKKTFQQVKVGDVRLKEVKPVSESILTSLNSIFEFEKDIEIDKDFLNKTELKEIEKSVKKAEEIKRNIQKRDMTEYEKKEIRDIIKKFDKIFDEVERRKQIEESKKPVGRPKREPAQPFFSIATTQPQIERSEVLTNPLQIATTPRAPPQRPQRPAPQRPTPAPEEEEPEYEGEPLGEDPFYVVKMTPKEEVNMDLKSENAKGMIQGLNPVDFYNKYGVIKKAVRQFLTANPYY